MITRIVHLTFQEHQVDEFFKIFDVSGPKIRACKGCKQLELVQDIYHPHMFFTISKWDSEESLEAYRNSEVFRGTWKKMKKLFSVPAHAWTTTDTGK
ncbi:MAG: antibiotic biosynthesis monooxygenase [Flavobacteriales bacterium]|nr:antibiotic biosynthesis monooxygenase [Flavobacteriales bacterium]